MWGRSLYSDVVLTTSLRRRFVVDWRQKELARIDESLTGAERKVARTQLIDEEAQLISCIARRRSGAIEDNKKAAVKMFLNKACTVWYDRRVGTTSEYEVLTSYLETLALCHVQFISPRILCIGYKNRKPSLEVAPITTYIFTARRYVRAVYAVALCQSVRPSACLSVCVSSDRYQTMIEVSLKT